MVTILIAVACSAAGPLVVDLDAQADTIADAAFKVGDTNRDKSLNEKERKKATQELLRKFIADGKKQGADGITIAKIVAMVKEGNPDANADAAVTLEELREFVRDAWTARLEIMMGPAPAVAPPLAPPVVVVVPSPKDDDDDALNDLRELRRRERQRMLQREWERRQRDRWEQWQNSNNQPASGNDSGPRIVYGRQGGDDRADVSRNDRERTERPERSSRQEPKSSPSTEPKRTSSRSDKDEKSSSSSGRSRGR